MFVCLHVSNKLENQSIDFQNSFIVGLLGPSGVILPSITMLLLKEAEQRNASRGTMPLAKASSL
jgi:hypothetical protein